MSVNAAALGRHKQIQPTTEQIQSLPDDELSRVRLWTLHPRHLDPQGLVALWREALLARCVLRGQTRGYRHHPQLARFRDSGRPVGAIDAYLADVLAEAQVRGYRFDARKLRPSPAGVRIAVTAGQLAFEWGWLREKLRNRNPAWLRGLPLAPAAHPVFAIVPGPVATWERAVVSRRSRCPAGTPCASRRNP